MSSVAKQLTVNGNVVANVVGMDDFPYFKLASGLTIPVDELQSQFQAGFERIENIWRSKETGPQRRLPRIKAHAGSIRKWEI